MSLLDWWRALWRAGEGHSAAIPPRNDAKTMSDSVKLIATMKGLERFSPRSPDDEVPREVFQEAGDRLGRSLGETGWSYARSGPHISRSSGSVRVVFHFGSDSLNVAGELVVFMVTVTVHDRAMAVWRESEALPIGKDPLVMRTHIGGLLPEPAWTQWNLANERERGATVRDIEATIRDHGFGFAERAFGVLTQEAPATTELRRVLGDLELVEYLLRFGRQDDAKQLVRGYLARTTQRRREWHLERTRTLWREGLPSDPDFSGIHSPRDAITWTKLPYLIARYELATEHEMAVWASEQDV